VVSVDAELYCLEKASGKIVWMTQLDKYKNEKKRKGKIVWTGPVMVEGHLVLGSSEGEIVEVNPVKGEVVNKIKGKEEFLIAPSVADGTVYFLANDGTIVSLK
jgi:outer membrane protein assembly factor BamB